MQDFFQSLSPWRRDGKPLYETHFHLGSGSFGTVKVAKMAEGFERVAVKSVQLTDSRGKWSSKRAESVWHEVEHSRQLICKADRSRQS